MTRVGPAIDMECKTNGRAGHRNATQGNAIHCHTHGAWCPRLTVDGSREQGTREAKPIGSTLVTDTYVRGVFGAQVGFEHGAISAFEAGNACKNEALNRTF